MKQVATDLGESITMIPIDISIMNDKSHANQ